MSTSIREPINVDYQYATKSHSACRENSRSSFGTFSEPNLMLKLTSRRRPGGRNSRAGFGPRAGLCPPLVYIYIEDRPATDDRPTTDLTFGKISNGHISAKGRPIHFMFGSTVGFSRSADRIPLFPVSPNTRWRHSNGDTSTADCQIYSMFGSRMGFSGSADQMALIPV